MTRWWWQRALVTGASAGLGEHMARQLAAAGVATVLVARRRDRLERLAAELSAGGAEVELLPADLRDPAARAAVEQRLADDAAVVDLLVNNAGVGAYGSFAELDRDVLQAQIDVNVTALARLAHAAVPAMAARGRGTVLNVSSLAALQPQPHSAVYAATKAFVSSLSQALHEEARGTGVCVTALCPGETPTEFQRVAGAQAVAMPAPLRTPPARVARHGLDAAAAGRDVAVPGRGVRLVAAAAGVLPARVTRRLAGRAAQRRSTM